MLAELGPHPACRQGVETTRDQSLKPLVLEALLFGQAGLLEQDVEDAYCSSLIHEYEFLKQKFSLQNNQVLPIQFFRLRPPNFPTIRLSQLANLYSKHQNLFSKIIELNKLEDFYELFKVSTSEFWKTHYTFETESKKSSKKVTKAFVDLLLINTIIPLKFAYLKSMGKTDFSSLLALLEEIKPEKNNIISKFHAFKIKSTNAFETQALLQLKNEYCSKQLCLQCEIGKDILKN